jgi:hypothetical protein
MKSSDARWVRFAVLAVVSGAMGCSNSRGTGSGSVDAAPAADAAVTTPDAAVATPDTAVTTPDTDAGPPLEPDASVGQADGPAPDLAAPPQAGMAKLDLLFVVDNTATNIEEQRALAASMPAFVRELKAGAGNLLDLHFAFVSTNMGAGNYAVNTCPPLGDRGRFQVRTGCGLDPQVSRYLTVDDKGNQNFSGELDEVSSCLVQLGAQGCTYGHPLQALRFALSSDLTPENRGFLRDDAVLAIVLVADEDDCSADPEATFFQGLPGNFICALRGHACNGASVPAALFSAPLATCEPFRRVDDPAGRANRLINVDDFTSFVKSLKPDHPERVLVAALIGWDDRPQAEYRIALMTAPGNTDSLELAPVCLSGTRPPKPALRLKAFVDGLAPRASWHSVCPGDLAPTMQGIARRIAGAVAGR